MSEPSWSTILEREERVRRRADAVATLLIAAVLVIAATLVWAL